MEKYLLNKESKRSRGPIKGKARSLIVILTCFFPILSHAGTVAFIGQTIVSGTSDPLSNAAVKVVFPVAGPVNNIVLRTISDDSGYFHVATSSDFSINIDEAIITARRTDPTKVWRGNSSFTLTTTLDSKEVFGALGVPTSSLDVIKTILEQIAGVSIGLPPLSTSLAGTYGAGIVPMTMTPVPIPPTLVILTTGLMGLGMVMKRSRKNRA